MIMWIFGCGSVALAAILDSVFRAQMTRFGYKWHPLKEVHLTIASITKRENNEVGRRGPST
jgi:hypothetical protein